MGTDIIFSGSVEAQVFASAGRDNGQSAGLRLQMWLEHRGHGLPSPRQHKPGDARGASPAYTRIGIST
jgi:hypothetical protein